MEQEIPVQPETFIDKTKNRLFMFSGAQILLIIGFSFSAAVCFFEFKTLFLSGNKDIINEIKSMHKTMDSGFLVQKIKSEATDARLDLFQATEHEHGELLQKYGEDMGIVKELTKKLFGTVTFKY